MSIEAARELRERLHFHHSKPTELSRIFGQAIAAQFPGALADLHRAYGPYPRFRAGQDQHTDLHQQLYHIHQSIGHLYSQLAEAVVSTLILEPCYIQAIPTYRFGFPDNVWVGSFHRDSDFGHSAYELNCILALTPMRQSAALHVEDSPGSRHFEPLELDAFELMLFNHIDRQHGCLPNQEAASVVSLDFRFVPERFAALAFQTPQAALNTQVPMVPGGYFSATAFRPY
jgi:hypothetical protein